MKLLSTGRVVGTALATALATAIVLAPASPAAAQSSASQSEWVSGPPYCLEAEAALAATPAGLTGHARVRPTMFRLAPAPGGGWEVTCVRTASQLAERVTFDYRLQRRLAFSYVWVDCVSAAGTVTGTDYPIQISEWSACGPGVYRAVLTAHRTDNGVARGGTITTPAVYL